MKKVLLYIVTMFIMGTYNVRAERLELKQVVNGTLSPKYITGINVLEGTDMYSTISTDRKKIECYSFKTGKKVDTLFDLDNTHGDKINGFDGYLMSPDKKRMLIRTQTKNIYRRSYTAQYYIYNIDTKKLSKLSDGGSQQNPIWSKDGNMVAFVRDNNIFLVKLLYDNAEMQVTTDGSRNKIINGIPDWVGEEEFSYSSALEFNDDGTMLCWIRYDETAVKTYDIQMYKGMKPTLVENDLYPSNYSYKYPKAGEKNSIPTVWSYDIKSRKIRQLSVPVENDGYIPRIKKTPDASKMIVYTMNRHQDILNLYTVNPRSGVSSLLIKEQTNKYVKVESLDDIRVYNNTILFASERDGYMSLYLYDLNGKLLKRLSEKGRIVSSVYGYDEVSGDTYYQVVGNLPGERDIVVTRKSGKIERLTVQKGWNNAIFSSDYKYFINTYSDLNTPYTYTLRDNKGKVMTTLLDNNELLNKLSVYNLPKAEMFDFVTNEGTKLYGWMMKPNNFNSNKKYPVIMFQYSGPGSQQVVNSWQLGSMANGGLFDKYLSQEGFIIVCIDGRGTGGRGAEFEKTTYLNLGDLESKDQVSAAKYLSSLSYIDSNNIGIWGWSFGGFNTLMSMSTGENIFKAGVAIAAPTSWRYYDTIYTERYMRTPKENANGYEDNPISRANKLSGALLLIHGTADDNVHPQNAFEYSESLVQADKDFKEIYYTNRNHGISGGNTRLHLLRQLTEFFKKELK